MNTTIHFIESEYKFIYYFGIAIDVQFCIVPDAVHWSDQHWFFFSSFQMRI